MPLPHRLVGPPCPGHDQRRRWRDRLGSLRAFVGSSPFSPGSPAAPDQTAQWLYDSWLLSAGYLWITGRGDIARRDLVEHLRLHPELLVDDPTWRDRLIEVTVARATQVLLPHDYDRQEAVGCPVELTDEVRDMLHGRGVIEGARIPSAITAAFIAADRLLARYDDARIYEDTPLGVIIPGRRMDEFPECSGSIDAATDLLAFLGEHPELAGTRDFAAWFEAGSIGPRRDGP